MKNEKIYREIERIRKKESERIGQFLLGIAILTFFVFFLFAGFLGKSLSWTAYFLSMAVLIGWLAYNILKLESEKNELEEKVFKQPKS
ncbi:MAG: hypothetical protein QXK06_05240 [Candidatus Diapherotrites archaeon]